MILFKVLLPIVNLITRALFGGSSKPLVNTHPRLCQNRALAYAIVRSTKIKRY